MTRVEEASGHKLVILRTFLKERFPSVPVFTVKSYLEGVCDARGKPVDILGDAKYGVFSGLGNPEAFVRELS